ncbi:initiator tRNA phosphoribosyl transferase [Flagelloscypha sp. PMI_526]|nr:initiator tRNA phosphoribosyl transferase [Flagelloscypha sp. PMI_526]
MQLDEELSLLAKLRRESIDLYNRLHSIDLDSIFVANIHTFYGKAVPLVPNLRAGEWYVDPDIVSCYGPCVAAYFKSTDGHTNNWGFNLRRPNMHLLPLISERGYLICILVDSTRSGKSMPDALSKTVPIWCSVVNRAILLRNGKPMSDNCTDTELYTPLGVVSRSEHSQIEQLLDGWAQNLASSSYTLDYPCRPLRPIWITPSTQHLPHPSICNPENPFIPIICVSASRQVQDGVERVNSVFSYVQGSGDDHELWGGPLTPGLFWQKKVEILSTPREQLRDMVQHLVASLSLKLVAPQRSGSSISRVAGQIQICSLADMVLTESAIVRLTPEVVDVSVGQNGWVRNILIQQGKKGQMLFLQQVLPEAMKYIYDCLLSGKNVCIACPDGRDQSVGVALCALALYFSDDGQFKLDEGSLYDGIFLGQSRFVYKKTLRRRLEWIISSRPEANPSRTTLKRVNEFVLSRNQVQVGRYNKTRSTDIVA